MIVTVEEAQPKLKELLQKVAGGESVVITDAAGSRFRVKRDERENNEAILWAAQPHSPRETGRWRGGFEVGADFFEPLDESALALSEGGSSSGVENVGWVESAANQRGHERS